jgi:Plasmid pRiA4b ORF-3-like protein
MPASMGSPTDPKARVELTSLGRYAIRRVKDMAQPGDPVLQIQITLLEVSDASVWREVIIPASYTLDGVHRVIREAMGLAGLPPARLPDRRPRVWHARSGLRVRHARRAHVPPR